MDVNLNMFGSLMLNRVRGKVDCTNIATINNGDPIVRDISLIIVDPSWILIVTILWTIYKNLFHDFYFFYPIFLESLIHY